MLPAICTEERITLGAELEDGTVLRGQNQISHPPPDKSIGKPQGGGHSLRMGPYNHIPHLPPDKGIGKQQGEGPREGGSLRI